MFRMSSNMSWHRRRSRIVIGRNRVSLIDAKGNFKGIEELQEMAWSRAAAVEFRKLRGKRYKEIEAKVKKLLIGIDVGFTKIDKVLLSRTSLMNKYLRGDGRDWDYRSAFHELVQRGALSGNAGFGLKKKNEEGVIE